MSNFRDSFGLLLPAIADHFQVGRAEAALTSSFMTLLTLGSGQLTSNIFMAVVLESILNQFLIVIPWTLAPADTSSLDISSPGH